MCLTLCIAGWWVWAKKYPQGWLGPRDMLSTDLQQFETVSAVIVVLFNSATVLVVVVKQNLPILAREIDMALAPANNQVNRLWHNILRLWAPDERARC